MKRHLAGCLGLLIVLGCGASPDDDAQPGSHATGSGGSANSDTADSGGKNKGQLPDDPFFNDFAYSGAEFNEALTMGGATSAWFKTSDDMTKVTEFYSEKFAGGNNLVEAERAYFTKIDAAGIGMGATVNKQPDASVQIILKLEKPKLP